MNQILEFDTDNRKSNFKPNKSSNGSTSDTVVKVFAILLMVFATILIISGVVSLVKNNSEDKEDNVIDEIEDVKIEIAAELNEEDEEVIISIESEFPISTICYNWNSDTERKIDGEEQTTFETAIDVPIGSNTLHVKVTDVNGNEASDSFDIESETGDDIVKPNITLTAVGDTLIIEAVDETEIAYLTYRWNDDLETTVSVDSSDNLSDTGDKTTIKIEIEIPKGKNDITVIAVDASNKHNAVTRIDTIDGMTLPEISYEALYNDAGNMVLRFTCTSDDGLSEVHYTLNDNEYSTTIDNNPTEIEFDVTLESGYNYIELTVTSSTGAVGEFKGECDV